MDTEGALTDLEDYEVLPVSGVSTSTIVVSGTDRFACLKGLITGMTSDGGMS